MSKTLQFDVKQVVRLLDHTEQAPGQNLTFEDLCDPSVWLPGVKPDPFGAVTEEGVDRSKIGPRLFFVHDSGVYLMSGGNPGLLEPDNAPGETRNIVTYAKGLGPDADYDAVGSAVGYDDFGIAIEAKHFRSVLNRKPDAKVLTLRLNKSSVSFGVR